MSMRGKQEKGLNDGLGERWWYGEDLGSLSLLGEIASVPRHWTDLPTSVWGPAL
ncbi:hypothetical protein GCM10025794_25370 [Massilia kyonggiensis]